MIEYYKHPRFGPFSLEHPPGNCDRVGILLVHGFTGSPPDMRPLAEMLHGLGADCHALMHPGMATDMANLSSMTASIWREAVLECWQEHTSRYERTILVGYSMGGAASIQMAVQRAPDLLLLLAPFWRINDRRAVLLPVAKRVVKEFKPLSHLDFEDPYVREWFKAALPDLNLDDPDMVRSMRDETGIAAPVIDELRKFGAIGRREASRVTAPVVVIQGHQDTVVNPRHTRQLIDEFPHLMAYHEIPGDHMIPLDTAASWPTVRPIVVDEVKHLLPLA